MSDLTPRERRLRAIKDLWTVSFAAFLFTALVLVKANKLDWLEYYVPFSDMEVYFYPLLVLFITVIIARIVSKVMSNYFRAAAGHLFHVDKTRYALFTKLAVVIIYLFGAGVCVYLIPGLRSLSLSLFAGAGVLAIVIGFATQKTLGNLVSGVMIAIYQPYRIGDKITLNNEYGTIEDITLRHTVINTWDNRRVIVPNSKMDEEVINNYTIEDPRVLGYLDFSISYDSDIDLARMIIRDEVLKHPDFIDNRTDTDMLAGEDPVKVRVIGFAESAITLRVYFWAADQPMNFRMGCELRESVKKRFDREGVEIPFPYRTIVEKRHLKKPKRVKRR